jgi:hypothetical protein
MIAWLINDKKMLSGLLQKTHFCHQNQPGFGQKNTTAIRRGDQNMVFP